MTDVDFTGHGQVYDDLQTVLEYSTPGKTPSKSMAEYLTSAFQLAKFYVKYFDPRPVSLEYIQQHCALRGTGHQSNRYYFAGGYSVWDHSDEKPPNDMLVIDVGDIEIQHPTLGRIRRLHWALTGRDLEDQDRPV